MIASSCLTIVPMAWSGGEAKESPQSAEPLRVAVFEGDGVGERGIAAVSAIMEKLPDIRHEIVTAEQIREGVLERFDVVMFTGGSGSRQADALEPAGREKVKDHLVKGGGFIGICAGAYLSGGGRERYLHLFPFQHHLPWRLGGGYIDIEITGAGRRILNNPGASTVNVRYNNGPVFFDAGETPDWEARGLQVLAYFRQAVREGSGVMVDQAAMVAGKHGAGRFISISPHPETLDDDHAHWIIESSLRHVGRRAAPAPCGTLPGDGTGREPCCPLSPPSKN